MLLAGNYRCITKDGMRTAQEAVHSNLEESRSVYNFVFDLCVKLGAKPDDLVPFEKYAAAAQSLTRPASAARALQNGAPNIERADKLVQLIARQKGLSNAAIDAQVALGRRPAGGQSQEGGGVSGPRLICVQTNWPGAQSAGLLAFRPAAHLRSPAGGSRMSAPPPPIVSSAQQIAGFCR